jgi:glycosyltransferase involved in cell wall biosynthesis
MDLEYSAVLTTYNSASTIEAAIKSILDQSVPPKMIFICDDSSFDATPRIIDKYCDSHQNITKLSTKQNSGPACSRNLILDCFTNKYIIFFDDDDISHPRRSQVHLNHFQSGADLSYVSSLKKYSSGYEITHVNEEFAGHLNYPSLVLRLLTGLSADLPSVTIPAATLAITSEKFTELSGFDPLLRRLEDVDLSLRAASENSVFHFSSESLVTRFYSTGKDKSGEIESISQSQLLKKYQSLLPNSIEINDWYLLRRYYFERKYLILLFSLFKYTFKFGINSRIVFKMISRLKHDLRIFFLGKHNKS